MGPGVGALVVGLVDGAPVGVEDGFAVSTAASAIVAPLSVVGNLAIEPTNSPMVGCSVSPALLGKTAMVSATGASPGTSKNRDDAGSRNSRPSFVAVTQPPQKSVMPLRILQSAGGTAPFWTAL